MAIDLAAKRPCAAVMLEAPFTSAKDVARAMAPVIGPLIIWGFNSQAKIGRIRAPIFVMHGDQDQIILSVWGRRYTKPRLNPNRFG